jgi:Domain of unknown function (DUF4440)
VTKALSQTILIAVAMAALLAPAPRVRAQVVHADSLTAPVDTTLKAVPDEPTPAQHSDALSQVVALEDSRRKAMVAADVKTLDTIIAPDATYVHSTGIMQNRDELLRLLANQTIRYISFDVEKATYRVYGGTVVGTGVQQIKVMQGKKSRVIRSRYTVVYAERNGTEQLIAYQSTPLPEMTGTTATTKK